MGASTRRATRLNSSRAVSAQLPVLRTEPWVSAAAGLAARGYPWNGRSL